MGTSENALRIQIWTALIAILLLKWLHPLYKAKWSLSNLASMLRLNLFTYRDLQKWLDEPFGTHHCCPNSSNLLWPWRDLDRYCLAKGKTSISQSSFSALKAFGFIWVPQLCPILDSRYLLQSTSLHATALLLSNCAYQVIASCCASSCSPARAGGAWKESSSHT